MLGQIHSRQNDGDNIHNCHINEEEVHNTEQPPPPTSSSVDVDVIKDIQVQLASLTQWDELKKVGTVRPYLLE